MFRTGLDDEGDDQLLDPGRERGKGDEDVEQLGVRKRAGASAGQARVRNVGKAGFFGGIRGQDDGF
jgi:hypothetical protein